MMSSPSGWGEEPSEGQATDGDHGTSPAQERKGEMSLVIPR